MRILITATTGIASFRVGGRAVYSQLMLFRQRTTDTWVTNIFRHNNIQQPINVDIFIIDEYSMPDAEMLDKIIKISNHSDLQHIKIVFCGDLRQLQ